jgi:hypothetical protein
MPRHQEKSPTVNWLTPDFAWSRHGCAHGRRDRPAATDPKETTMFKTLVAVVVLAGASLSFIANASAAPKHYGASQPEWNYFTERHNPTDTNGF